MMKLRKRAHLCLDAFKEGKAPTPTRSPADSPSNSVDGDEEDELLLLGGKNRLISGNVSAIRTEAASPANSAPSPPPTTSVTPSIPKSLPVPLDRSPSSMRPVIPLPHIQMHENEMHPTVIDYLRTFVPSSSDSNGGSQPHPTAITLGGVPIKSNDMSGLGNMLKDSPAPSLPQTTPSLQQPSNIIGSGSTPSLLDLSAAFYAGLTSFHNLQQQMQQQQMQQQISIQQTQLPTAPSMLPSQPQQPQQHHHDNVDLAFPAYFPAFDYNAGNGFDSFSPPLQLDGFMPPSTGQTPEAMQMDGVWEDFVAQLGM